MLRLLGWVWRVLRAARLSLGPFVEWAGVAWGRGQGAGLDKTRPLTTLSHQPMFWSQHIPGGGHFAEVSQSVWGKQPKVHLPLGASGVPCKTSLYLCLVSWVTAQSPLLLLFFYISLLMTHQKSILLSRAVPLGLPFGRWHF